MCKGQSFHRNISDTAAHTCGKVLARAAEDNGNAARHIFAAVVADTLNNDSRTGVSYAETLACNARDERLAARCAEECNVADDDVLVRSELGILGLEKYKLTARKSLAEVVVAVALKGDRKSLRDKCAETLTACTVAVDNVCIFIKSVVVTLCDLRTEDSSEGSVEIVYIEFDLLRLLGLECKHHLGEYLCLVDSLFKLEIKCIGRIEVEVALAVCERIFENCAHIDLCSLAVGSEILLA